MSSPVLTVREFMQPEPVTVDPDCPLDVVLGLMNLHRIGALLVVSAEAQLLGIFTDRDLLRRVGVAASEWQALPVSTWMTREPFTIPPEAGWDEAVGLMERHRIRHLPVVENGKVIGLVSSRMLMSRRTDYLNRVVGSATARTPDGVRRTSIRAIRNCGTTSAPPADCRIACCCRGNRPPGPNSVGPSTMPRSTTSAATITTSPKSIPNTSAS